MRYGIDFGTTNSVVSVKNHDHVQVLNIDTDIHGKPSPIFKSVIFFGRSGKVLFGTDALRQYTNDVSSGRLLRSTKSLLSEMEFTVTAINGKPYSAEDLTFLILREIKQRTDAITQQDCQNVTLGHPVIFSENPEANEVALKRLVQAASRAGFSDIKLIPEPVGAGIGFIHQQNLAQNSTILVIDIGGGTSDFCLLRFSPNNSPSDYSNSFQIIGTQGARIGGDTIDSTIMWEYIAAFFGKGTHYTTLGGHCFSFPNYIGNKLRWWHLVTLLREPKTRYSIHKLKHQSDHPHLIENLEYLIDQNNAINLFQEIEHGKIALSSENTTTITFDDLPLPIRAIISREDLERVLQTGVSQLTSALQELLQRTSMEPSMIDHVVLTGGTTKIPLVYNKLTENFLKNKIVQASAFTSVAYGLSLYS